MNQDLFDQGYQAGVKNEAPLLFDDTQPQSRMWSLLGWVAGREVARFVEENTPKMVRSENAPVANTISEWVNT